MKDELILILVWSTFGVVRYLRWNKWAIRSGEFPKGENLVRVLYFSAFCALGPLWLISIINGNG